MVRRRKKRMRRVDLTVYMDIYNREKNWGFMTEYDSKVCQGTIVVIEE